MRTHRLIVNCNCKDFANYIEEILQYEFGDLFSTYNGLLNEGEDTPDLGILYKGAYNKNRLYVEFNKLYVDEKIINSWLEKSFKSFKHTENVWKFGEIKFEEIT